MWQNSAMGPLTREQVLKFRESQNREQSRFYSGPVHALTSFSIMLGVVFFSLFKIHEVKFSEALVFPIVFVSGNFFIYVFHRWVLHVPRKGLLGQGYRTHTLQHHVYYTYDMIEFEKASEIMYVLFPISVVIGILGAVGLPLSLFLGWIWSANAGWMAMAGAAFFFLSYELIHGMCHLPQNHFILKMRIPGWIAKHHRIHHRPEICGEVNFDIVVPGFDYLFGTAKSE